MTQVELKYLHNACHDYAEVKYGLFPTWEETKNAWREDRLQGIDNKQDGFIMITGNNACHLTFNIRGE